MKKSIALLLSLVLCLSLVACGGEEKPAESKVEAEVVEPEVEVEKEPEEEVEAPAEDVEVAQGVTDTTVTVGNSAAVSGALAGVGIPFNEGIQSYFDMVNEAGGVNGRTIVWEHIDDEFKPELGKAAFEALVFDKEVFALVGHFGTPIVGATIPDIEDVGIPAVYFATGIGALYNEDAVEGNGRNLFPVQPIYTMEGRIMAAYAKGEFEAETIGVVHTNDEAGKDLLKGIEQEAEKLGLEIIGVESIAADATDATAQVSMVKDADVIIAAAIQQAFPIIVKEMEKQGIMKPVITTYVNSDKSITDNNKDHLTALISDPNAGVYSLGWVQADVESEEWTNFIKYMTNRGHADKTNAYAMTGWVAASFFIEGLERVGTDPLTWDNYMTALEEAPVQNPFGGFIDFSNGQRLGTGEMNLNKMDPAAPMGWTTVVEIKGMDAILGE